MTGPRCRASRSARCPATRRLRSTLPKSGRWRKSSPAGRSTRSTRGSSATATRPTDLNGKRDGRMRLTLVGGFLGSGKTTWLRHQLHEGLFRDAVVVVNEAAGTPVDDALLSGGAKLAVLAGGCACCETKAALV